ncbi:Na+/H+ antiporter subunit A [Propionibacteriaceae bacterium Y1923]
MLLALIMAHFAMGAVAPALSRVLGRRAFFAAALVPLVSFIWLLWQTPTITSGNVVTESYSWISVLGVSITFQMGLVQWVLGLVVTGIGALVLFYCRWYFGASGTATRCLGLLTAFAGAMLGLVTSDNLVLLYVFWEVTTVFSYLLIGNDFTRKANRGAALTALIVTTFGGLAMLAGIIALGVSTDSFSLAVILERQPTGAVAVAGVLLMLVGALSKSALFPFHFWLPGAMAAATPISAYLHAAAMVKAGVYLVAVLAPVFADIPGWRVTISVLGAVTMLLGGWRALRQDDIKLLLAYGTVSQLGFLVLLTGMGTQSMALAGLAMVVTHALFKATLFLTVGIVDKSTGTRDLTILSGVGRQLPWLAVFAAIAAASMAGLPPLMGFTAKESALEGLVNLTRGGDGTNMPAALSVALVVVIVVGSMLTLAYSLRFVWGAFSQKEGIPVCDVRKQPWGMTLAPAVLAIGSLVGGFSGPLLTRLFTPYAESMEVGLHPDGLALWHGFTLPLGLSAIAIAGGFLLFWQRERVAHLQETFPTTTTAHDRYLQIMRLVDQAGVELTSRTQQGSLIVYLFSIFIVFLVGVGIPLMLTSSWPESVILFDNIGQPAVGGVMIIAALLAAMSRGRIRAVLLVGVTGYGTGLMFLLHGAPDLALTQLLVESVTVIVFLLLLRQMPRYFTNRPLAASRWWRVLLALTVGTVVTLFALVAAGVRSDIPASEPLKTLAKEYGYGNNIVNVILVDTRAWDTLGEVSVLVIAATGVASLIFLQSRAQSMRRRVRPASSAAAERSWLRGSTSLDPAARSLIFEVVTRLVFGVTVMVGVWVLLRGHNEPGGGFAGGLIVGMALLLRYLAAGREELAEAAPFEAGHLLGGGLFISVVSAFVPVFFGGSVLQSYDIYVNLGPEHLASPIGMIPWLGELHLVSSVVFDVGVFLIVVGVLLDYARSLGSGIDVQASEHRAPIPRPRSTVTVRAGELR